MVDRPHLKRTDWRIGSDVLSVLSTRTLKKIRNEIAEYNPGNIEDMDMEETSAYMTCLDILDETIQSA